METNQKELWKKRAGRYNNLEWTSKFHILDQILAILNSKPDDRIADVGCGTGAVLKKIAGTVSELYGVDISKEMLSQISLPAKHNVRLVESSIRDMPLPDNYFDKVISRMVFHHIQDDRERFDSVRRCYEILKKGGKMVVSEGVPPHECLKGDFQNIFALKEKRVVFLEQDIEVMMKEAGFRNVYTYTVIDRGMSVMNWLINDGTVPEEKIKQIMDLHLNSSDMFKKLYNLKLKEDGDILIDVKVAIVVGEK